MNPEFQPIKTERTPDLTIGGLDLWIWDRTFSPDEEDHWLTVTARCTSDSAVVQTTGSYLRLSELATLLIECKKLHATLTGEAQLYSLDPNLHLKLTAQPTGACHLTVFITPDLLTQKHTFHFTLDQTYLPPLITHLETILHTHPLKANN